MEANDITLRDYFAAKAMQALIAGAEDKDVLDAEMWAPEHAYRIADFMIIARERRD